MKFLLLVQNSQLNFKNCKIFDSQLIPLRNAISQLKSILTPRFLDRPRKNHEIGTGLSPARKSECTKVHENFTRSTKFPFKSVCKNSKIGLPVQLANGKNLIGTFTVAIGKLIVAGFSLHLNLSVLNQKP